MAARANEATAAKREQLLEELRKERIALAERLKEAEVIGFPPLRLSDLEREHMIVAVSGHALSCCRGACMYGFIVLLGCLPRVEFGDLRYLYLVACTQTT